MPSKLPSTSKAENDRLAAALRRKTQELNDVTRMLAQSQKQKEGFRLRLNDEFFRGVLSVLSLLKSTPSPTIIRLYGKIIETIGIADLRRVAEADGTMKHSGLAKHLHLKGDQL